MTAEKKQSQQIKVRYNETTAQYASQFIVNTTKEDVILNISSGPITDPQTGETLLPIHTRLAMTRGGAQRLHAVLGTILEQKDSNGIPPAAQAQLPKIKQ